MPKAVANKRDFFGRAWVNFTRDGRKYIRIQLDRGRKDFMLKEGESYELWPNRKRGEKDATLRLSVLK